MDVSIITDSTCDLGPGGEVAYDIDIVPLTVNFGDKAFKDGIELSSQEFYDRLSRVTTLPTTSQPAPAVFQAIYRRRLDEGKEIVGVFISTTLSGTYQSAVTAMSFFSDEEQSKIHLVDSRQATGGLALLVLEACSMRDRGVCAADICAALDALKPRVKLYAALDTLRYLRMGGRLSATAAFAGGILNVVPVISLDDGVIVSPAKIRRGKNAFRKWLRGRLNTTLPDLRYPVVYLHSNNISAIESIQEEFKYLIPSDRLYRLSLGAVIGTHAGPDAIGIVYAVRDV